jgi:hypothetical protein
VLADVREFTVDLNVVELQNVAEVHAGQVQADVIAIGQQQFDRYVVLPHPGDVAGESDQPIGVDERHFRKVDDGHVGFLVGEASEIEVDEVE